VMCQMDSRLTVGHLNNEYQVKDLFLLQYYRLVRNIVDDFDEIKVDHVPRGDNIKANVLSKLASTKKKGKYRSLL